MSPISTAPNRTAVPEAIGGFLEVQEPPARPWRRSFSLAWSRLSSPRLATDLLNEGISELEAFPPGKELVSAYAVRFVECA
jgi:hypothetical protein